MKIICCLAVVNPPFFLKRSPPNVQRQKYVQHRSLIVQVLASATLLFIVMIKTMDITL